MKILIAIMIVATGVAATAQTHVVHGSGGGTVSSATTVIHGTFGQPITGELHHFETLTQQTAGFWFVHDTASAPPPPDTTAAATIAVDTAGPSIGDLVSIPIRLLNEEGLDQVNADTVQITLRFEATCVEVRETTSPTFDADTAMVTITALRSQLDGNVLSTLDLRARLGSVTGTVIRVTDVVWRGAPSVSTTTRDGLVEIDGICMEGGRARLVQDVQAGFIRQVSPNPARSMVRVLVDGPAGVPCEVRLRDMVGRMVASVAVTIGSDGRAEVLVPCDRAANGLYAIQLTSNGTVSSTPVVVRR